MADTGIATAADYADAMLTARSAKNWLFLILLVSLLLQLAIFFLYHFEIVQVAVPAAPTTARAATTTTAPVPVDRSIVESLLHGAIRATDFLGIVLAVVLALVLLLVVNIMLVGRLIGVARVTSACVWTLLLMILVFPWQFILGRYACGVLYTWGELTDLARWHDVPWEKALLSWARFAIFPALAVIILMSIQVKSVRGIRQALGEGTDAGSS